MRADANILAYLRTNLLVASTQSTTGKVNQQNFPGTSHHLLAKAHLVEIEMRKI